MNRVTRSIAGATAVALGLAAVATPALAGPPPWARANGYGNGGYGYGDDGRYDRGQYDGAYVYARVVDVDPIVREIRSQVPRQECWNDVQTVYRQDPGYRAQVGGPTLLGGIIGGVLGSQIGHGRGRTTAAVAGTLLGASVAHAAASRNYSGGYAYSEERPVERCAVRYDEERSQRIEGYRVTYEYQGRQYNTQLPYDPGDRIRVRVDVAPAPY